MYGNSGVRFQLSLPRTSGAGMGRGTKGTSNLTDTLHRLSGRGKPTLYVLGTLLCMLILAPTLVEAGPRIQQWTLDNGARVFFVETHDLPMVEMSVVFDAGSAREPATQAGVARLTSHILNEGADGLGADAIALGFERLGAEYGAVSDRDMARAGIRVLSDPALRDPAAAMFARVLTKPSFPQPSLDRMLDETRVALAQKRQSPGEIAEDRFYAALYGKHPYAHAPEGTDASLKRIARDDLVAFHARYYTGANAVIAMVGDLTPAQAQALAQTVAGGLPRGAAAASLPPVMQVPKAARGKVERVRFPSAQTHILVGQPGMARVDPDYFALYVGNYVLGGSGLVSRLSDEVREKRGLSYSAYSYLYPLREPGPLILGLQTKNTQADAALKVLRDTLTQFTQSGPTDAELVAAKKNLSGGFPLRLDSNRKIAEYLAVIGFYGLPADFLETYVANVEAVTADAIRDAFRRRVQPADMVTVIVGGDAKTKPKAKPKAKS